jgi:hypothetical protein
VILWRKESGKIVHGSLKNGSSKVLLCKGSRHVMILNYTNRCRICFRGSEINDSLKVVVGINSFHAIRQRLGSHTIHLIRSFLV